MPVKFSNVSVRLVGQDGNAFAILGRVAKAMRIEGVSKEQIDSYLHEAMSKDYHHLLQTTIETVNCDVDEECDC